MKNFLRSKIFRVILIIAVSFAAGWFVSTRLNQTPSSRRRGQGEAYVITKRLKEGEVSSKKKIIAKVIAINSVDIRPQVAGYIDQVLFKDGSTVKEGEKLFVIDQSRYKANVAVSEAELSKAKSSLGQIKSEYNRQQQLYKQRFIPKAEIEIAENKLRQAEADVVQAEANLKLSKINLEHTEIKSPITGVIGRALITKGNYVDASSGSLARIVQTSPIRVSFGVTDKERLSGLQGISKSELKKLPIQIVLADGTMINAGPNNRFFNNEVDSGTATISSYIEYENKDNLLVPGNYVDVLIGRENSVRLTIPQSALGQDIGGIYAMVINDESIAEQRYLELGDVVDGGARIVLGGVKAGEQVVVQGLQKVSNGQQVKVTSVIGE